ncbi:IPT/TIG domain-containing protein [Cryobacterium psychrophilum]|uniref:Uncharacterized protein n=1 Tax=Cryobacterium psychrophilum TaxID=41988 RepID=A0A4Y8KIS0_9MICO|nr:IPT/TIG domain-containing protein [Cryobacterium psychrophilum]TDW30885.1 IPT/TIG domain-containing protein [Cryobacterium psychrophilum]TFD75727.1 hypothetical protein E3T53_14690 [Cryobacterium psychrophilum]
MKKISMTLSSSTVELTQGKGTITASVTNASAASDRVVLGAFPAGEPNSLAGSTGAQIADPLRTIEPGATVQYEVRFNTAGGMPGTYGVKLIPYSADEAPEDYAELGFVVQIVVPEVVPVVTRKFPWWILAIVGAVLILGGAVTAFLLTRTPAEQLVLSSFTPTQGGIEGGTTVILTGRFGDSTIVTVGETAVAAARVSDTEVTFSTPPAGQAGQVPLTVDSDGKQLGVAIFEYVAPQPTDGGGGGFFEDFCAANPQVCVAVDENKFIKDLDTGEIIKPEQVQEFLTR